MGKDPEGGPHPAYPTGKSWDPASGPTGSGKKFYHNVLPGSKVATEQFYVAIITPVIHYCMGGLEITEDSEVCRQDTTLPVRLPEVSMETIVWAETHCSTASCSAVSQQRQLASTCTATSTPHAQSQAPSRTWQMARHKF